MAIKHIHSIYSGILHHPSIMGWSSHLSATTIIPHNNTPEGQWDLDNPSLKLCTVVILNCIKLKANPTITDMKPQCRVVTVGICQSLLPSRVISLGVWVPPQGLIAILSDLGPATQSSWGGKDESPWSNFSLQKFNEFITNSFIHLGEYNPQMVINSYGRCLRSISSELPRTSWAQTHVLSYSLK